MWGQQLYSVGLIPFSSFLQNEMETSSDGAESECDSSSDDKADGEVDASDSEDDDDDEDDMAEEEMFPCTGVPSTCTKAFCFACAFKT